MGAERTTSIDNSAKSAARTENVNSDYELKGSTRQRHPLCFHISADQGCTVLIWDMEKVFFMVGNVVLRQINGLPMGSPPSPVLANLTCGVGYEQSYIAEMGTADGERIWGIRSMDDVVTVGTYTIGKGGSYERAVQSWRVWRIMSPWNWKA